MLRAAAGPGKVLRAGVLIVLLAASAVAQAPGGIEVVQHGGYPELQVDGAPFFVHSAVFFYYRIPRDLWEVSLERYRELGINTIDLPIPWNWHEPGEGEIDFDGHSHPRRDLRTLLRHIAERGFKLIVRPGPILGDHWKHGGYPDWLLGRPEYKMDGADRLAGLYPPLAIESSRDAEAAARGWLENATHVAHVQKWFAALAQELAPYSCRRALRVKLHSEEAGQPQEKEISGPLLFMLLDEGPPPGTSLLPAASQADAGFARYTGELCGMLEAGLPGTKCIVHAPGSLEWGLGAAAWALAKQSMGTTGQWFLPPLPASQRGASQEEQRLTAQDASQLALLVETLNTQTILPAMLSGYQAGWYAPPDDVRPPKSLPANTLLSTRLLLAHGLHGLDYSTLCRTR